MLWEAVLKHLGKINQVMAGLVLGVALVWRSIPSSKDG